MTVERTLFPGFFVRRTWLYICTYVVYISSLRQYQLHCRAYQLPSISWLWNEPSSQALLHGSTWLCTYVVYICGLRQFVIRISISLLLNEPRSQALHMLVLWCVQDVCRIVKFGQHVCSQLFCTCAAHFAHIKAAHIQTCVTCMKHAKIWADWCEQHTSIISLRDGST